MSILLDLLLGTGAVLGAALAGAVVGLVVALLLPSCLFVLGQIIFGIRQPERASGFAYPPDWYRKVTAAVPMVVGPVPMIVLVVLVVVAYPPARIPSTALLVALVVLMLFWMVKYRQQRKQEQERAEQEQVEALKEGKRRWRREHGLLP